MTTKTAIINKSNLTNFTAFFVVLVSFYIQDESMRLLLSNVGFFALSGALTNWIAIHMLFERIPFLYGSGVIQNRFEDLKFAIKSLIQKQFFTQDYITVLVEQQKHNLLEHSHQFADAIDYDALFKGLIEAVMGSSLGGMLQMVGGEKALEPIAPKFKEKMHETISVHLNDEDFKQKLKQAIDTHALVEPLTQNLEAIIDDRLSAMTPKMVKALMKEIMHQHLGWLVVWGGVFGGLIGLLKSVLVVWY